MGLLCDRYIRGNSVWIWRVLRLSMYHVGIQYLTIFCNPDFFRPLSHNILPRNSVTSHHSLIHINFENYTHVGTCLHSIIAKLYSLGHAKS